MAYILETGKRPLIFIANPRTGSTAIAHALIQLGATGDGGHHMPPRYVPENAVVFHVIRSHWDVLNSLWYKGMPLGDPNRFAQWVVNDGYGLVRAPMMYDSRCITHTVRYDDMRDGLAHVAWSAGVPDIMPKRTPSRTAAPPERTFNSTSIKAIHDCYRSEMRSLRLPEWPQCDL